MHLKAHPLADIFPMMSDAEIEELANDIGEHGQREPIYVTHDQLILDGRNRFEACRRAGVNPIIATYTGAPDDMAAFVISLNLKRRHLSESQRAMVAGKLANLRDGQRADRVQGLPIGRASELLNVGERTVARAREVLDSAAEEVVRAVESGRMAVSAASDILDLPADDQAAIATMPAQEMREAIRHHRTIGTGDNEWYTPDEFINSAREVLGTIDLDPASNPIAQARIQASNYFTIDDNGLAQEWRGNVWLNPPYAQPLIGQFVEKLVFEAGSGNVQSAVLLTNSSTDTAWFHLAESAASLICFTRGRIRFISPTRDVAAPTQGQAFFYFGNEPDRFSSVFQKHGFVR